MLTIGTGQTAITKLIVSVCPTWLRSCTDKKPLTAGVQYKCLGKVKKIVEYVRQKQSILQTI